MERLTEAERVLKYGVIPEEEGGLLAFRKLHKVSMAWRFIDPYGTIHFSPEEVEGQGLLNKNILAFRIQDQY